MGGGVILMYHRIGNGRIPGREAGEHLYAIAPETFEAQLETLVTSGATVVSVDEFVDAARPLPAQAVAITFDDGNASDHEFALGALRRRGLPAAFFVTPAWVGTPGYMSWPQVRELRAAGMTIGAHGLDHTPLATLAEGALREHLREARRVVAAELGESPRWLALPGGSGARREVRLAREVGFAHVLGSVPRLAHGSGEDPIPRFAVRQGESAAAFRALVRHGAPVRMRFWLRHQTIAQLRWLLGPQGHRRLRSAWMGTAGDE